MTEQVLYRVVDPIENFKMKVGVREVSRISHQGDYMPFNKDIVLSWQQKIHGPYEVIDFISHNKDEKKKASPAQQESRKELADISGSRSVDDLLQKTMLYTYTERDHYANNTSTLLVNSSGAESYVGAAINADPTKKRDNETPSSSSSLSLSSLFNARSEKVAKRENYGKKSKTMHICLATDVDVATLLGKEHAPDIESHLSEHILCSFRLYQVSSA